MVSTTDGHAPVEIVGGPLYGISYVLPVPTAQVKGAVLLAGVAAEGESVVIEPAATRDHTERALAALGAPVTVEERPSRFKGCSSTTRSPLPSRATSRPRPSSWRPRRSPDRS